MKPRPIRSIAAFALTIVIASTLASCGKKEPLKPPPGATYPRQYPPPPPPPAPPK